MNNRLEVEDFAQLFGCDVDDFTPRMVEQIASHDWLYAPVQGEALDDIVCDILGRIRSDSYSKVVEGDASRWERGWRENLECFIANDGDVDALRPKYIRKHLPVRLFQEFVLTSDPDFEMNCYRIFTDWLFTTYFSGFNRIVELGCGSGINIAKLMKMFPKTSFTGVDWVQPSVDIMNGLAEKTGRDITGRLFDFFDPDYNLKLTPDTAVLTIGAFEQIGTNVQPILDYMLTQKAGLVVHIEPVFGWYDPKNLVDYTAYRCHQHRNFTIGYFEALDRAAEEGRIEVLKRKRAYFGSYVIEGYSQYIWRVRH